MMTTRAGVWASVCLTKLEPMKPAPPVTRMVPVLASGALRIHQCQFEFLRQRLHRGAAALPRAIGLEPQAADFKD